MVIFQPCDKPRTPRCINPRSRYVLGSDTRGTRETMALSFRRSVLRYRSGGYRREAAADQSRFLLDAGVFQRGAISHALCPIRAPGGFPGRLGTLSEAPDGRY